MFPLILKHRLRSLRRGITLIELLIAMTVSSLLLGGVLSVVLALARTSIKTERLEQTATAAREIQELITMELNAAINLYDADAAIRNRPSFASGDGAATQRYRSITYRTPVGPPGNLTAAVPLTSTSIAFYARAALRPVIGDYFVLDTPKLGRGIRITGVSDSRAAGTDGTVTVTLFQSLSAGTVPAYVDASLVNAPANSRVEIQRERAFVVDPPASGAASTTLRWIENNSTGADRVLTDRVAADSTYLFRPEPDSAAGEFAIGWSLILFDAEPTGSLPGTARFFSSSSIGGSTTGSSTSLIMPKSGNSLVLSNPFAAVSTSVSTTTTSTTSTTTSTTSTTKSTSTTSTSKSTSTTSTSKSTSTTSTSKSTTSTSTSKSTSTTSTSKSTTKSTTTTSKSTTSTTSKSTTSTSKSTTKSTTSTSKSTTKSTSTKSTSTKSTTSTSKSTTKSTTSTSKSTTKSTTTTSKSTTSTSKSTSTTSTSKSTSTTSTSKTTSTTSKSTSTSTTSIPFDG